MKIFLENYFEMPDKTVALLVQFLEQGKGKLSERAKTKEFKELNNDEIAMIETKYQEVFPIEPKIIFEQPEFPPYKFYKNTEFAKYNTWRIDVSEKFKILRLYNIFLSPLETKNELSLEIAIDTGTEEKKYSYDLADFFHNPKLGEYLFFNEAGYVDILLPKGRKWVTMKMNLPRNIKEFHAKLSCEYK